MGEHEGGHARPEHLDESAFNGDIDTHTHTHTDFDFDFDDGEGLSTRRPETPACPDCGCPRDLRPTDTGHWIPLEPELYPAAEVPTARRWFDTDDGRTVARTPGAPARRPDCRVAHRPVCAAHDFSPHWPPLRAALWLRNRAVAGLPYDESSRSGS
ncbi:DUF6083 domain-containing protein [Streptomyces huiliensis]|uniref:DUF6083 domain-containing protein n=1 Tax=Streptomyces huiliensis TaxID=2876027 RepID=UPI001CBAFE49|nr:DUF6083 domain-containing protein [Streptomyces huiliensis]MBZ4319490.1 hypothetical protein [Streptomyces huiliensis]